MEQSESEHVIDITSSSGASSSSSSEDTVNQSNSRLNQDLPSTSMTAPVFQHSFSISNGGNTRNTSFGRRESGHGRRNPLNSGYWISTEIVITVSQIIAAIVVLCLSRHELPQAPLFTWVIGFIGIRAMSLNQGEKIEETQSIQLFSDEENVFVCENEASYSADLMIHQDLLKKISKLDLNLDKTKVFKIENSLMKAVQKAFKRKNEIFYCVSTKEISIDINDVSGQVYLPLITKEEIGQKLSKIPTDIRKKMNFVHIGALKILIKAQFRNGIDTPIKMALLDNRINNRRDSLLGVAQGNLAYDKFMFTVYPEFGVSLKTQNLNQILSFVHKFERTDLMNRGYKVFTITYLLEYALTNSHHSIDYRESSTIEIEDLFQEIGSIQENHFKKITNDNTNWVLDISKNKNQYGETSTIKTKEDQLLIDKPRSSTTREMVKSMSKRIDSMSILLKDVTGP
ncbi:hypothetical protein Ccrd_006640 [Cynara cardunculus var. scolymus]|uniref:Uncharacterized protein n=1 Tax=Cynara cardunculus var. scolymus TaxID=59895 RepID=A0A103XIG4_CYNCS|nr:hypothetical protein Ccrd_006640 [Cynara cardunculus var. scolymus]